MTPSQEAQFIFSTLIVYAPAYTRSANMDYVTFIK